MANLAVPDPESNDIVNPSWERLCLDDTTVYTPLVNILGSETTHNSWLYVYPLEKGIATHTGTLKDQKNDLKNAALAIIRPQRLILKAQEKASPAFLLPTINWLGIFRMKSTMDILPLHCLPLALCRF